MSQLYRVTLSIISLVLWMNLTVTAQAFNCKKASTTTEKTICKTSRLKSLDRRMSKSFYNVLRGMNAKEGRNFKKSHGKWLRMRNSCGSDTACLQDYYDGWMSEYKVFLQRKAGHKSKKVKKTKTTQRKKSKRKKSKAKGATRKTAKVKTKKKSRKRKSVKVAKNIAR